MSESDSNAINKNDQQLNRSSSTDEKDPNYSFVNSIGHQVFSTFQRIGKEFTTLTKTTFDSETDSSIDQIHDSTSPRPTTIHYHSVETASSSMNPFKNMDISELKALADLDDEEIELLKSNPELSAENVDDIIDILNQHEQQQQHANSKKSAKSSTYSSQNYDTDNYDAVRNNHNNHNSNTRSNEEDTQKVSDIIFSHLQFLNSTDETLLNVDDWEDDDDNGYLLIPVSEDEFYEMEEVGSRVVVSSSGRDYCCSTTYTKPESHK